MSAPLVAPNKIVKTMTIFKTVSQSLFLYSKDLKYCICSRYLAEFNSYLPRQTLLEVGCNPEDFDQVIQVYLSEIVAKLSRTFTLQEHDLTPLPYSTVQPKSWSHFKLIELLEPEVVKEFKQTEMLYSIQIVYSLQHHKQLHHSIEIIICDSLISV